MSGQRRGGRLAAALLVLSAIPTASGMLRLIEVAGGPAVLPANHRYGIVPVPLVIHIVAAIVFVLAGIAQFLPAFRRNHPTLTALR